MSWRPGRVLRRLLPTGRGNSGADGVDDEPLLADDLWTLINRLALDSQGASTEWLSGEHTGRRKAQAIEFADYRGYAPGDDFRMIDWNAYARLGELFVKTSLAPESLTLSLLLDCSASMDWGRPNKLRYAKRLAAIVGAIGLLRADTIHIYALVDGKASPRPPLRGSSALRTLTDQLEEISAGVGTDLPSSIEAFGRAVDPRGTIMLLSDLLVPMDSIRALGQLVRDTTAAAVLHIVDTAEAQPALTGSVELRDVESGEGMTLTITSAMRRRYAQVFEARTQSIEAACAAQKLHYVQVLTTTAAADIVSGLFRQEQLVRS